MNTFQQRDLVTIKDVACGIVELVEGDIVTVSRDKGEVLARVHYTHLRKLAVGDAAAVGAHPTPGTISELGDGKVSIKRADGKGGNMTHWVDVSKLVPLQPLPAEAQTPPILVQFNPAKLDELIGENSLQLNEQLEIIRLLEVQLKHAAAHRLAAQTLNDRFARLDDEEALEEKLEKLKASIVDLLLTDRVNLIAALREIRVLIEKGAYIKVYRVIDEALGSQPVQS